MSVLWPFVVLQCSHSYHLKRLTGTSFSLSHRFLRGHTYQLDCTDVDDVTLEVGTTVPLSNARLLKKNVNNTNVLAQRGWSDVADFVLTKMSWTRNVPNIIFTHPIKVLISVWCSSTGSVQPKPFLQASSSPLCWSGSVLKVWHWTTYGEVRPVHRCVRALSHQPSSEERAYCAGHSWS